jgi:Sulfatase
LDATCRQLEGRKQNRSSPPAMKRRLLSLNLLVLAAVLTHAAETKPNILVIVADDLGYADIGIHGGKDVPTPNIDALAASGVRCTSGYVPAPYCSPSRAGFLTGRSPTEDPTAPARPAGARAKAK